MKILVLDDATWELAKKKIEQELNCTSANASMVRAWNKLQHDGTRWHAEKWVRRRHIQAIRLAKLLTQ